MSERLPENTYAVIIAVENYQFGIKQVDYAKNDAHAFQQWLINDLQVPSENIKLWFDAYATATALNEELCYEISQLNENDRFIFYYAGHGFYGGGYNRITTWETHPFKPMETTIALNDILLEPLRNSDCNKSLIFIDSCASHIDKGMNRDILSEMNLQEFVEFVRSSKYRAMFLSCSRGEQSYGDSTLQHGIWTYHLLKALKGEAPEAIEKGCFITDTSLRNYLRRAVPAFIKTSTEIRGTQTPWAEVSSSNTFTICEIQTESTHRIDTVYIPERLIIKPEHDMILAYLQGLKNDGRPYPMFDFEGLEEIDVEAFCARISKIKNQIGKILEQIVEFLMEYEWEEEVIFESDDDKVMVCAFLNEDVKTGVVTVSLSLSLHISGLHPMGDTIFDSEFDAENDTLSISVDECAFDLDEDEIHDIFRDCWDEIRRYFIVEKEIQSEIELEELISIFDQANRNFLEKEKSLILSGVSERTLCGALTMYLQEELRETIYSMYYVDVEYNRNNGKVKTIVNENIEVIPINCDIIVHSRGEILSQDNLIALEMKKSTNRKSEKLRDKNRLVALTKDSFDDVWSFDGTSLPEHVCRYGLGIYYEVDIKGSRVDVEYYKKGILFETNQFIF
ncbi:caspase family protein [Paenibacillus elgii]|uniref:caspase family protein n=1 Tax=Paenibacillus elgii TaxID=189691 RepID=UPI001F22FA8B|nr:caspase family protein [Paenibacillus elgii]